MERATNQTTEIVTVNLGQFATFVRGFIAEGKSLTRVAVEVLAKCSADGDFPWTLTHQLFFQTVAEQVAYLNSRGFDQGFYCVRKNHEQE